MYVRIGDLWCQRDRRRRLLLGVAAIVVDTIGVGIEGDLYVVDTEVVAGVSELGDNEAMASCQKLAREVDRLRAGAGMWNFSRHRS